MEIKFNHKRYHQRKVEKWYRHGRKGLAVTIPLGRVLGSVKESHSGAVIRTVGKARTENTVYRVVGEVVCKDGKLRPLVKVFSGPWDWPRWAGAWEVKGWDGEDKVVMNESPIGELDPGGEVARKLREIREIKERMAVLDKKNARVRKLEEGPT